MTRLAHLVLVLTAIAPVRFVFAATRLFAAPRLAAGVFVSVAAIEAYARPIEVLATTWDHTMVGVHR